MSREYEKYTKAQLAGWLETMGNMWREAHRENEKLKAQVNLYRTECESYAKALRTVLNRTEKEAA
jgi:hypothetical protein